MNKIEMPSNEEAEVTLICGILCDQSLAADRLDLCSKNKVGSESFYSQRRRMLWAAISNVQKSGGTPDLVSITEQLRIDGNIDLIGGAAAVSEYATSWISDTSFGKVIDIVKENESLRRIISVSLKAQALAAERRQQPEEIIREIEVELENISESRLAEDGNKKISEVIDNEEVNINRIILGQPTPMGVPTGFKEMDGYLRGLQPANLIILAARPACGKTALCLAIIQSALSSEKGINVLFFSIEMSSGEIVRRLLSFVSGVSINMMLDGVTEYSDKEKISKAKEKISKSNLWVNEIGTQTVYDIRDSARRLHSKNKVGLIVVDYLQIVSPADKGMLREQQIAEVSRQLKALSKELNCPVLALAQIGRGAERENRKPKMSDLRESGSIEQDADVVMFIHRDMFDDTGNVVETGWREIMIAKNRHGTIGSFRLGFDAARVKFEDIFQNSF